MEHEDKLANNFNKRNAEKVVINIDNSVESIGLSSRSNQDIKNAYIDPLAEEYSQKTSTNPFRRERRIHKFKQNIESMRKVEKDLEEIYIKTIAKKIEAIEKEIETKKLKNFIERNEKLFTKTNKNNNHENDNQDDILKEIDSISGVIYSDSDPSEIESSKNDEDEDEDAQYEEEEREKEGKNEEDEENNELDLLDNSIEIPMIICNPAFEEEEEGGDIQLFNLYIKVYL